MQIEKTKNRESSSSQPEKRKTKFRKGKNTLENTSHRCYKGHVANNDLLDADSESLSPDLLELDKDKVEEVAAYS